MECRIIILYRINQFSNCNFCFKLLFYLTNKSLLRCFTFFNLSTWKFPSAFKVTIASLCCENNRFSGFIYSFNNRCYYSYCFDVSLLVLRSKIPARLCGQRLLSPIHLQCIRINPHVPEHPTAIQFQQQSCPYSA